MSYTKFSLWVEQRESDEAIKAAVLDAVPEDLRKSIHDEDELLGLKTDSIRLHPDELLSRGEIKQVLNPQMEKQVRQAFEKGATLGELLSILQGTPSQPAAEPQESVPPPSTTVNFAV